jgi:hypothetical protein
MLGLLPSPLLPTQGTLHAPHTCYSPCARANTTSRRHAAEGALHHDPVRGRRCEGVPPTQRNRKSALQILPVCSPQEKKCKRNATRRASDVMQGHTRVPYTYTHTYTHTHAHTHDATPPCDVLRAYPKRFVPHPSRRIYNNHLTRHKQNPLSPSHSQVAYGPRARPSPRRASSPWWGPAQARESSWPIA